MDKDDIAIDPDEEIIITGNDILFLVEGVGRIAKILDTTKIKDKKADHDLGVSMMALTVGLLRLLPRDKKKSSAKLFEEIMGINIDQLL